MSTTVDSRVVEMRFDNKHFESNVSTTMSTLDKLKQKLHLDGASKGLENVSSAAKRVDMTGLSNGVETVSAKFSALDVMGVTALANITNSAVNAGKRIVSALTIDPIKTGFQEYEMKMDSIKTIVNSTGRDLADVNKLLEELNEYSDQTIYSFRDMTQNIGKFTNAGVNLEDAVLAIKGISNEAAVSGASAQEASRAMYNFSQALSSGYVKLIDWKSIENANMATKEFKQQLIDTAVELGVVTKAGDMYTTASGKSFNATKNFNDVLQEQWMTTDVLIKTLGKYADENTEIGKKAFAAAQEVTKMTQMWDVLKETAQSGWAKTWELIVGDLEGAKAIFTPLTNFFSGIIDSMSDARNRVLEIALDFARPWQAIADKVGAVSDKIYGMTLIVKNVSGTIKRFQTAVDRVWAGDFGNQGDDPDRRKLLQEAGYDDRVIQHLVNLGEEAHKAGETYELTIEDIEAAHKKFGYTVRGTGEATDKVVKAFNKLSDEQLKNAGLTEEEIRLYRALEQEAEKAGISVSDLANEMSKNDGRSMLIDSFKNIGNAILDVARVIKATWIEIFNPPGVEELGIRLYGIIRSFKEFTSSLKIIDKETGELTETGKKFQSIFKGIFAAIDIVLTVLGGPLKIVFRAVTQLLGYFGVGVLDVAAYIGDAIVMFRDWIDSVLDFTKVFDKIVPPITNAIDAFRNWIASLRESENLPRDIANGIASGLGKAIDAVKNFFKKIPDFFTNGFDAFSDSPISGFVDKIQSGLKVAGQVVVELGKKLLEKINKFLNAHGFKEISVDAIAGLVNGLKEGASKAWNSAVEMAKSIVQKVKDFLGIHSPSKVFYAIGGFIIAGLIAGLQNGIPDSLGAVKDIFQPMLDWINGIDFGAVFAAVLGIGTAATTYKAVDALASFASMFEGIGELLESTSILVKKIATPIKNVVNGFAKIEKALAFNMRMEGVKTLATSLLMLVGAIVVLTFFEPAELWNAVGVVAALAVILAVLAFAMNKLNSASASIGKGGIDIKGLSSGLTGIGIAILLLGLTVKMIGSLDPDQAKQGFLGLGGIVLALAGVIAAFGLLVKGKAIENVDRFGKTMTKLAIAFLLMAVTAKLLGAMDRGVLIQGGVAIAAFAGVMVGLMAATKLIAGSKNVETIGATLLKIALGIAAMGLVAKILGEMDRATLIQGGIAIAAFAGIMVGLMAATKLIAGSKHIDTIGSTLLKIAIGIGVMGLVVKLLGGMDPAALAKGTLAITAFAGIIVGLMAATKLISGGDNVAKIGGTILAISGAIAIMALTAFMLSMISWEGFAKGTTMITIFAGIVVGLIAVTKLVGPDADKIGKTIITIAAAIGVLGLIAVLLSLVPTENLVKGLVAITVLSAIMAGLIAVTKLAQNCWGTVLALAGVIAVLAGSLYLISIIPVESLVPSAIALGGLLVVMTGVLAALNIIGKTWQNAMLGIAALGTLIAALALIGLVLAMMSALNVTDAIPNAIALSVLCTVLTVLLIPLALIGSMVASALLGVLALTAMAVPLVAFVGVLALMQNVQNGVTNAKALGDLMLVMGTVLFMVSLVAPLIGVAVSALYGMATLMGVLGIVAVAIGALVTEFPQIQTFLDTGIPILEQLASGLGSIIASFITGFVGETMAILPELGACLSQFMTNAMPFIVGAKLVDESVLDAVGILTESVFVLAAADMLAGVASFLQGGSSFASLGTQLSQFMLNAMPFITGALMINPAMMDGVKSIAETILILTETDVLTGLTSWLTGGSSLESFAAQLPILGTGLAAFSASIGSFTEDQVATVNCAAQAIKTLASASAEIPNAGGLLGAIVGENDLGTFADQFPILGTGLAKFLTNVGTFTEEQVATVDCAANAIKSLASAASEIPNSGGWVGAIVGENDLGTFAAQFPKLGTGLAGFLTEVGTFTDEQVDTVNCAANAVKTLASVASQIPNEGGWLAKIVGENNLGTFADNFPKLGEGLAGFASKIGTYSTAQVSTVNAAVQAVQALTGLANADLSGANANLSGFSDKLPGFAEDLASFCSGIPSADSTSTAVDSIKNIISVVKDIANANSGCLSTFADNLKKVGTDAVDKFVNAFTSNTVKVDLKNAAKDLGDQVVDGIEAKERPIKSASTDAAKEAVSGAKTQKEEMKSAGKDLGSGLVQGINSKQQAAYDAGFALGQKAVQGEKDGQQSNSPSKLTIQSGKWIGEGLVIGINQMANKVYKAGSSLGRDATSSISKTISRVSDMVNTDVDSQPTIRPVLDLSDVKSGVGTIGNLLNMNGSVGVMANVGSISSMMNRRGQNGANDNVVSAIDKLRKDIGNLENRSYTIGGITYSSGDEVSNAIETLVRAVRVEGRA